MLSNSQKKLLTALKQKKLRSQYNSFVVEGIKMVEELLLSDYEIGSIFATQLWIHEHPSIDVVEVSERELSTISSLKTPNQVLAIVKKKNNSIKPDLIKLTIALDNLQDPGNLGTIIRTADWFGVSTIICSEDCVDVYNPKVIQATMGSFFRINVIYTSLTEFLNQHKKEIVVYGALLGGENVYKKQLDQAGAILLMGNESNGISEKLLPLINEKIMIPKIGSAESLNVAVATAIFCSEFAKR